MPGIGDEGSVTGWSMRVDAMDGRRVDRLRFTPLEDESEGSEGAEALRTDPSNGGESA